jgi:hypothetical protein
MIRIHACGLPNEPARPVRVWMRLPAPRGGGPSESHQLGARMVFYLNGIASKHLQRCDAFFQTPFPFLVEEAPRLPGALWKDQLRSPAWSIVRRASPLEYASFPHARTRPPESMGLYRHAGLSLPFRQSFFLALYSSSGFARDYFYPGKYDSNPISQDCVTGEKPTREKHFFGRDDSGSL